MSVMIYRIDVRAKQPLSADPDSPDYPTLEGAASAAWKRDIEKGIIAALRRFELDCAVELMDFTVEDE